MAKSQAARAVAQAVAGEVRSFCEGKADPQRAAKYARYFKEGYDAYGIHHEEPDWYVAVDGWSERLSAAGPLAFLDAGDLLVRTGKYEEASTAILLAERAASRFSPEVFDRIGGWFDGGIGNWGHTDVLCGRVLGVFLNNGIVTLERIAAWGASPHKYQRRALPVTLIEVLKKGTAAAPLLAAAEPLMMDGERVVQQGLGWFLREAWKREPARVERLLLRYKDRSPRLIFQYATEKMTAAQRDRFRKKKKNG
jgi:3-methyladenine DNA glycosylase AlkD